MNDYYFDIMGLSADASTEQIRFRYKQLVRIYHPDRMQNMDDKRLAEEKLKAIIYAYNILTKPQDKQPDEEQKEPVGSPKATKFRERSESIGQAGLLGQLDWRPFLTTVAATLLILFSASLFMKLRETTPLALYQTVNAESVVEGWANSLTDRLAANQEDGAIAEQSQPVVDRSTVGPATTEAINTAEVINTNATDLTSDDLALASTTTALQTKIDVTIKTNNSYRVNARQAATTDADVLVILESGSSFTAIGRTPDTNWIQIQLTDDRLGWLSIDGMAVSDDSFQGLPVVDAR